MSARVLRRAAAVGLAAWTGLVTLSGTGGVQSSGITEESGARLQRKLVSILHHASTESRDARLTSLPEPEINAFLMFQGVSQLPTGITDPVVRIGGDGRLSVEAVVNLSAVREERARGWLDPLQYVTGRLPVTASGTVRSGNGVALVKVESVTIAGVPMPTQVLQEVVRYYTRTPEQPDGTRLDDPIPLPFRITELRLSPGVAVVVQ